MSDCSCMGSMNLPTDFDGRKERQTYILWAHEGRIIEGCKKDHSCEQRIMKTDAMEPKGKEYSREVEIDGQNSQIRNSEASTARRKR